MAHVRLDHVHIVPLLHHSCEELIQLIDDDRHGVNAILNGVFLGLSNGLFDMHTPRMHDRRQVH